MCKASCRVTVQGAQKDSSSISISLHMTFHRLIKFYNSSFRQKITFTMACAAPAETGKKWRVQSYAEQNREGVWPQEGRHILAQYDEDSVVVYQAYCPDIAEYAVRNQK